MTYGHGSTWKPPSDSRFCSFFLLTIGFLGCPAFFDHLWAVGVLSYSKLCRLMSSHYLRKKELEQPIMIWNPQWSRQSVGLELDLKTSLVQLNFCPASATKPRCVSQREKHTCTSEAEVKIPSFSSKEAGGCLKVSNNYETT